MEQDPVKIGTQQRRKRGYVLSAKGWQRLQAAIQALAQQDHPDGAYTLQELSKLTGLSPNTLTRVRSRKIPVDRQTLTIFFQAFDLTLIAEDYSQSEAEAIDGWSYVLQGGQLPLDSPLYVLRASIYTLCTQALLQPGGLVRLQAAKQMGKTSLAARALTELREQGSITLLASLQLADATVFAASKRFFQWFCAVVAGSLGLPNRLDHFWEDQLGNTYNCTRYFEEYLLPSVSMLVVALDELDVIFEHPTIAVDFLHMLRAWHEKARYPDEASELWQKLRLLLIHSLTVEMLPHLHTTHFNVGCVIEVPRFTLEQVLDLTQRYQLEHLTDCAQTLIDLVGGHPYLTQLGLYHLKQDQLSTPILPMKLLIESVYSQHLRRQLWELQPDPDLLIALKQVVQSPSPIDLHPLQAIKLQSRGLIQLQDQQALPSCNLYRHYFQQTLALI